MNNEKIRKGQKAFNDLYESDPEIANMIRGTIFDPFYQDNRLPDFYKKIEEIKNNIKK
jgi:hypothetical protein